jgi:integrase
MKNGMRALTDEEVEKVREKLRTKYRRYGLRNELLFLLGVKTGFRVSEILSIKVKDVMRYDDKVLDVLTVSKRHIKGKTYGRTIPMHPEVKPLIRKWVKQGNLTPDDYLFKSQKKDSTTPLRRETVHDIFMDAFDVLRMGTGLGTHCMRKTFATNVYKKLNYDIFSTQKALGHRFLSTTVQYLKVDEDKIKDAILNL